jgi:NAD(P)-dependent dehydrogenase (short-subunit alcohol dehydrogenase family)
MNRLSGKRALITGGTSGIGLETAEQFLAEGARVAVTGGLKSLENARRRLGPDVLLIQADAGLVTDQRNIADSICDAFGQLDIVFVNAGVGDFRPLAQRDEAGFDRTMAINLKGPYFLLQALAPILADPSSVIPSAAVDAHLGGVASSVYAASKAGLISLARTLSAELISRGVRVNALSPGPISTPFHGRFGMTEPEMRKRAKDVLPKIPAGRFGEPSEIAMAVVYLASDESAYAVGSEIVIDGGMSRL